MSNFEMISTDRLDPRDRMNQIPRLLRFHGFGMQSLPEHENFTIRIDGPNQGRVFTQIDYTDVYGLHCARIKGSAYGLMLSRAATAKHVPRYGVIVQKIGISRFKLDSRVVELPAGAWLVVDLSRLEELVHELPFEHLILSTEKVLGDDDQLLDLTSGLLQPASARGAPQLFYDLTVSFFDQISCLNEDACQNIIKCLSQLCKAALAEDRQDHRDSSRARRVRREAIARFVNTHLGDHNLCVDSVARAFRCSTRTIQRIFSETEKAEPLNRYIWRSRLERSAIALITSKSLNRSITAIAEAHGFGSVAHFSRLFRQQFNMSPTDYSRRGQSAPIEASHE
jgi:AraC family transcriptional activator of tynA and feaB